MGWTILNRDGEVSERGLSLRDAANEVMAYDGHEWEIRATEDGGFRLFTSNFSRNSTAYNGLRGSTVWSWAKRKDFAEIEIYEDVLEHSEWWCGQVAMTDEAYDAQIAEWASEEA